MGKNANFVSHKKSKLKENGGPKLPLAADLVEGEIAINFGKDVETLSIKNESGDVVTFSSDNKFYTKLEVDERDLWTSGTGISSVAQKGGNNIASGQSAVAEGNHTIANGNFSHSEGSNTTASGTSSHAEGASTNAYGAVSHAEGAATKAYGNQSHTEGQQTTTYGTGSHAEGISTIASGTSSHAEGDHSESNGINSHAEGQTTRANGEDSHAEGNGSIANGYASHAEGMATTAKGYASHTDGQGTIANNDYEHASGNFNVSNSATTTFGDSGNTLFSVGNGTANNTRHNAFEIRQNGDIYIVSGNTDIKLQDNLGGNIDIDQTIDSGTSASTNAVSTSAVYGFITSYTPSITVDQVLDDTTSASTNPVSSKAVYDAVTDNELVWTNAFVTLSGAVSSHTENTDIHLTSGDVQTQINNSAEIEISSGVTPTGDTVEIWIDESIDPVEVEAYTKAETNALLDEKADADDVFTKTELSGDSATATVKMAESATTAAKLSTTTASTVTTSDSIVLEDTSGNPVRISRDSFVGAIRDVLGSSIFANTGGTSDVNKMPALTSSGALKSVSTSDLASVLGVGHLVHISQQENIVIPKGDSQAILACSINGPIYQPSLFLLGRKSGIIAINEEKGPGSNHMSFNDNGDIIVTGYGTYHFYYRLWLME